MSLHEAAALLFFSAFVLLALAGFGLYTLVHRVIDWWEERRDRKHPVSAAFGPLRNRPMLSGMPVPVPPATEPAEKPLPPLPADCSVSAAVIELQRLHAEQVA